MKKKQETAGKKRWKLTAEEKVEKRKQKLGYDPYLYEKIQPQGGICFRDPKFVMTGTGYEACLHIYEFPRQLNDYWMSIMTLMQRRGKDWKRRQPHVLPILPHILQQ